MSQCPECRAEGVSSSAAPSDEGIAAVYRVALDAIIAEKIEEYKHPLGMCMALQELAQDAIDAAALIATAPTVAAPSDRPTDDDLWDKTLRDRDHYHDMADQLAAQIAAITSEDIGEHSSANDPWRNAMLAADEFIAAQFRKFCEGSSALAAPTGASQSAGTIDTPEFRKLALAYRDGLGVVREEAFAKLVQFIDRSAGATPTKEA